MGLRSQLDPRNVGIFATRGRTLAAVLLGILPASGFLLPFFLERLLAYTLRLSRSGSIRHPLHSKSSRESRRAPRVDMRRVRTVRKSGRRRLACPASIRR